MNKHKKILTIAASTVIAAAVLFIPVSQAWFKDTGEANVDGEMGLVQVAIGNDTQAADNTDGTASLPFTITNTSTIGTYVRLGWTPIYRKNGKDLTKDVTSIKILQDTGVVISEGPAGLKAVPQEITSLNSYKKQTIIMENGSDQYFVVPKGENISGTITVTGVNLADGESLHLILVPEAIQATKNAADKAKDYGWDKAKAVEQDNTVVDGGGA